MQLYFPQSLNQELIVQHNLVPLIEGEPTPFGSFVRFEPAGPAQGTDMDQPGAPAPAPGPELPRPALTFLGEAA